MTWWHYLLLSNLYLVLFYGFYVLLLQRETFFQLNRVYLVGSAVMSFLIPVIQLDWVKQWFITQKVQETIYSASPAMLYRFKAVQPQHLTMGELIGGIYVAGIVVLSLKLIWQLFILRRIMQNKQVAAAWSFFKKIKVDEELESHQVIMAHEEVHARQWHSADVLLIEVIMILNWFNPVVYFYRRSIKHIHEFIADRDALKAGASKADYALLLLSQTFNAPVHHLLNPFWSSSVLKQRILMLQKNNSKYSALIKYGFSAPLFALMLALSSATINNSKVVVSLKKEAALMFDEAAPVVIGAESQPAVMAGKKPDVLQTAKPELKLIKTSLTTAGVKLKKEDANADSVKMDEGSEVFSVAEKLPEFVGGIEGFYRFLSKTLRYPAEAIKNNTQGRANVTFVVEKDGSLTNIRSVSGPGNGTQEEAERAISLSPKWMPGEHNGKPVRVQYTVPVVFTLDNTAAVTTDTNKTKSTSALRFQRIVLQPRASSNDTTTRTNTATSAKPVSVFFYKRDTQGSAAPLYIVDGKVVPAGNTLATLDPKKIASISVIKDEAARKTYGDKFSNGVVLITTVQKTKE
jgi:TonB family protein